MSSVNSKSDSLFKEGGSEIDSTNINDTTSQLEVNGREIEENYFLFDDELLLNPEDYIHPETKLDPLKLRQSLHSPNYRILLTKAEENFDEYCAFIAPLVGVKTSEQSYKDISVDFIDGMLSWACDKRLGKNGRRLPGIQYTSSLQTYWKNFCVVYREKVSSVDVMVLKQGLDVVKIVAINKKLINTPKASATMYAQDLATYCRVLLCTTQMVFIVGLLRIQFILFNQLAGITGNRPEALLMLQYRHLQITLVRDANSDRPNPVIRLSPEFTKSFLGAKDSNTFNIPEIICDPTLTLSPHVFLLGLLFLFKAFKSPSLLSAKDLYSLKVLDGLNEQACPLRDEIGDNYVFCIAVREAHGVRIVREKQLTSAWVRSRMKQGGEITGFLDIVHPYCLRDGNAKSLNDSPYVTESMQNLILQHANISTFLKHYLDRNISIDVQNIYRGLEPQKDLLILISSMSRSIDARRPWKLTTEQSASVHTLPHIIKLQEHVNTLRKRKDSGCEEEDIETIHAKALRRFNNEKQRQKRLLLKEVKAKFNKEQPVIDSERQLLKEPIDIDSKDTLIQEDQMGPEHLCLVNAIITLPGTTLEKEYERRINAINAVVAYCTVEEGPATNRQVNRPKAYSKDTAQKDAVSIPELSDAEILGKALSSVAVGERTDYCPICIGNPDLALRERTRKYATGGSLTRHVVRTHVHPLNEDKNDFVVCCNVRMVTRKEILRHEEQRHRIVSRGPGQRCVAPNLGKSWVDEMEQ